MLRGPRTERANALAIYTHMPWRDGVARRCPDKQMLTADLVDHKNRNMRSSNNLGSPAAQKGPLDSTVPMGGHDDQVTPLRFRSINDSCGR
ncbi:hypothetical protein ACMYR2_0404 [Nitrobacter sp. TKz-YC01]